MQIGTFFLRINIKKLRGSKSQINIDATLSLSGRDAEGREGFRKAKYCNIQGHTRYPLYFSR